LIRLALRTDHAREVGLSIVLALQVGIMFVLGPLAATGVISSLVMDGFRIGMAAVAVVLLARRRLVSYGIVGTAVAVILLSALVPRGTGEVALSLMRLLAATAFDLAVAAAVANVAFGQGRVTIHRIMGAVILYLSIALVFGNAYRACAMTLHPSFNGLNGARGHSLSELLYFSLTTLTTTGYGDITPVHPFVRSLANLEAVIGQLFPATLLARLVTLHAAREVGDA